MKKIAFYGKGGIGKSTISTNVAAAIADKGLKVMVIGCDPKTDCTRNLRGHVEARPLLDFLRDQGGSELDLTEILTGKRVTMDDLVKERVIVQGYGGTICIEIGGPEPGIGCAGRGIIVGVDILRTLGVFELYKPDVVLFDVPGDIVCGGLALPLRRELADQVYVITSSEVLPLHAANNLCKAIRRFATRGGSKLGGLIYNARGFIDRPEIVEEYARRIGAKVIGKIPRTHLIPEAEAQGKTVIESFPNSDVAMIFREVADNLMKNEEAVIPRPLSSLEFEDFSKGLQTL